MPNPADEFLMGGPSIPGAKFDTVGASVDGIICDPPPIVQQQTEMGTGKPLYFESGQPRMQLVATLQTQERENPEDDGRRRLFIRGSKDPTSKSLHAAVEAAVRAVNPTGVGLEIGARLRVERTGEHVNSKGYRQYEFDAVYTRPTGGEFLTPGPAAAPPPQQTPHVQQSPQPAAQTPEQQAALANLTPQQVQEMVASLQQQQQGSAEPPF